MNVKDQSLFIQYLCAVSLDQHYVLLFNYIDKLFQSLAGVQVHLFSKDYSTTKNLPHALGTAHSTERHNTN